MINRRQRIAVLVGQADEDYQSKFIKGLITRAFSNNMDVSVFAMYHKYQGTTDREEGESNILFLMNPDMYDGVVFLKDSIQTSGAADALENKLHEEFKGPVLVIEKESEYFDSVSVDDYKAMKDVVSHLIEVHNHKNIAFLTGKKWHPHSKRRLKAYRDAMEEHGLTVNEDYIIYGDFWYISGEACADYLTSLEGDLPEAVVCANDAMAIGLCDAFAKRGILVPDDIAVAGYDSTIEGQMSPKSITSAMLPAAELGSYSADFIKCKLAGSSVPEFTTHPKVVVGESCGCTEHNIPQLYMRRDRWETPISEAGFQSVNNNMPEDLMAQTTLTEYINTVYSYAYQIIGAESFHLCICKPWKYLDDESANATGIHVKNEGYSDSMVYAIRYDSNHKDSRVGLTEEFDTKDILPDLNTTGDDPRAFIFTPLFYDNECFGYAAVNYGDVPKSYDETYRVWINCVAWGFESLRRNCIINTLTSQLEKVRVSKFDMSTAAYENLNNEEREDYKLVEKILDDNLLTYHFQPIVKTQNGKIYSYEALMRTTTDKWISPLSIIKYANMQGRLSDVEKATIFNVLDIVEQNKSQFNDAKVFINSIPGVKLYEEDYDKMHDLLRKNSDVAVIELTEEAELSDKDLDNLKEFFKDAHVETAVDDYGTGYSNVTNLLRYMPNYVKIDRSLLSEIQNKPQKQHFVREIIEFCHDNNIMALAEGVETTEELKTVIHLGADLIQGYYTAKPSSEIITQIDDKIRGEIKAYYQERLDGASKQIYVAGKTNRVSLTNLLKEGATDILVGQEGMAYKDIDIIGTPSMKTNMHMRIEAGYNGRITLENVHFSNIKNRPCIEIGPNSDVTLILQGNNEFEGFGIIVPESSKLIVEGDGNLNINLNAPESFGIGNDFTSRHGDIIFEQDGRIKIHANGQKSIAIGSGLGGHIEINRGHYVLSINGDHCIGIGAIDGDVDLSIDSCLIESDVVSTKGVVIGSFNNNVNIAFKSSFIRCSGGGKTTSILGTIDGKTCSINMKDSSAEIDICSEYSTCMGSLHGHSDININYANIKISNIGEKALAFGGFNEDSKINLISTYTKVDIHNSVNVDTYVKDEDIVIQNGRRMFLINDTEYERSITYTTD